jgi:hypothetical protein
VRDELERRIEAAIDRSGGVEGDPELRAILESDPEAAAYARDVRRLGAVLRAWPVEGLDDGARLDVLAARIEQRLDAVDQGPEGILPRIADPTLPPEFDDDDALSDATAGLLGPVVRSGEFEVEEYESHPPGVPVPAKVIPVAGKPKSIPPPTPPPRAATASSAPTARPISMIPKLRTASETAEERISFSHIPSTAPGALGSAPAGASRGRAGWLAGLSAAAAVGLGVFVTTTMVEHSDAPIAREPAPVAVQTTPQGGAPPASPAPEAAAATGAPRDEAYLEEPSAEAFAAPTITTTTRAPMVAPAESAEMARADDADRGGDAPLARRMAPTPTTAGALAAGDPMTASPGGADEELRGRRRSAAAPAGASAPIEAEVGAAQDAPNAPPVARAGGGSAAGGEEGASSGTSVSRAPASGARSASEPSSSSGGGGGGVPSPAQRGEVDRSHLPEVPDRAAVLGAIQSVEPTVRACATAEHGTASVRIVVAGSGRVTIAQVSGQFAGTPVGSCVARAVRTARFPEFSSDRFEVTYPFQL